MTAQPERYVLIRVGGRGSYRIYHRLAADDVSPACGARVQHDHWDIVAESRARRLGLVSVRRCCSWCDKTTVLGGDNHDH